MLLLLIFIPLNSLKQLWAMGKITTVKKSKSSAAGHSAIQTHTNNSVRLLKHSFHFLHWKLEQRIFKVTNEQA